MTRRRWLVVGAVVALLTALLVSEGIHGGLVHVLAAAQSAAVDHPFLAAALVVLFAALAAMLAFVSSWAIVPFAVFTWGPIETLFLLWSGWLLGGAAAYTVGRFLGRPGVRWLTSSDTLARYEHRISPRSAFGLVLLLQLGLPSEIPGYLLGLVRYPFRWFLLSLGLAEMLHGIATVYLGAGLVARRPVPVVMTIVGLALLTGSAAWGLRRRLTSAPHDPPVASPIPEAHVPA